MEKEIVNRNQVLPGEIQKETAVEVSRVETKYGGACVEKADIPTEEVSRKITLSEQQGNDGLRSVSFADDIAIDLIRSVDYRIMCRFLGITSISAIKAYPYKQIPLITHLLMQSLVSFMLEEGCDYAGELNFDREGNLIPCQKAAWHVNKKDMVFTNAGFMYFEGERKDNNVVFFLYTNVQEKISLMTCYTRDKKRSEAIMQKLENYAKAHNCLKGTRLKDINMFTSSFAEVDCLPEANWENFYFSQTIRELFNLEVFGFLKNVKQYNEAGITKRGIILHGRPGTGKTTIGHIICNTIPSTNAVIWITPEIVARDCNMGSEFSTIKILYKLADFISPCVLILEDLDLFATDRDIQGGNLVLGALMNVLDGVNSINNAVTIGTTNRLKSVEKALRDRPGRFDRIIEMPTLSEDLRVKMFKNRLKDWSVSENVLAHIVKNTDNWTGAEIQELINTLSLDHIQSKKRKKSVSIELIDKAVKVMEEFGIGGKEFGFGKGL